ncbi:peptidoglycan-binding protein [Rhizobium sp. RCAM05350]|nr:peptidoglycan-binding protein [Rhizobium sp. RCAM05350]
MVGKKTRAAISAFQLASGLPETGEFDAVTVARMRALFETKAAA